MFLNPSSILPFDPTLNHSRPLKYSIYDTFAAIRKYSGMMLKCIRTKFLIISSTCFATWLLSDLGERGKWAVALGQRLNWWFWRIVKQELESGRWTRILNYWSRLCYNTKSLLSSLQLLVQILPWFLVFKCPCENKNFLLLRGPGEFKGTRPGEIHKWQKNIRWRVTFSFFLSR